MQYYTFILNIKITILNYNSYCDDNKKLAAPVKLNWISGRFGGCKKFNFGCTKLYKIKYIILYGLKLKFMKNNWSGCWCNVTAAAVKWNWNSERFGGCAKFNFGCTKLYKIKYIILLDYNSWFRNCGCWGNAPFTHVCVVIKVCIWKFVSIQKTVSKYRVEHIFCK
jgi:hypothetical protein